MERKEFIELLKDDEYYYNGGGRELISVSHIDMINTTPELYLKFRAGVYTPDTTTPMMLGGALHSLVLDNGSDFKKYNVIDIKGRNTRAFKEAVGEHKLTMPEFHKLNDWKDVIEAKQYYDDDIFNIVNPFRGESEVPNTIQIHGVDWKCKADFVTQDFVYDLKTSSGERDFKYSAYKYNYDAQAWLYSKMFNKEFKFIVINKNTLQVTVADCGEEFLNSGRDKIEATSIFYRDYIVPTMDGIGDKITGIVNYQTL